MKPPDPLGDTIREGEPPSLPPVAAKENRQTDGNENGSGKPEFVEPGPSGCGEWLRDLFFLLIAVVIGIFTGAFGFYLGVNLFHTGGDGGPHGGPNLSGLIQGLIGGFVGFLLPVVVFGFIPRK